MYQENAGFPMPFTPDRQLLTTILRHDAKTKTYRLALVRAIKDVFLSFPDVLSGVSSVASSAEEARISRAGLCRLLRDAP